jgi:Spy/CpxP family protein refolding chaperone
VKFLLTLALLGCAALAHAEPASQKNADELAQYFFPPELVMKYRQEIGLDDAQSKALKELMQKASGHFVDLQWDMQSETGKFAKLLSARRVDESAALAQMDKVLNMEREMKKAQVQFLLRIKNVLTDAQQDKLAALRNKAP